MLHELLEAIALALEQAGIDYMLIGGQAVLLYGEPRLTRDIDITLGAGLEKLQELVDLSRRLGLEILVEPEEFTRKTMVLPCRHAPSGMRVDFIFSFSPYERQALERVCRKRVGRTEVRYASAEDLIIHKIFSGRPRDLEDVKGVLMKNPNLDFGYIRHWLGEFEQALGQPFTERFESILKDLGRR
jgi:hypothetical protein